MKDTNVNDVGMFGFHARMKSERRIFRLFVQSARVHIGINPGKPRDDNGVKTVI